MESPLTVIGHMSYEIDRDPALEPSLVEMAETALTSLEKATKNSRKGKIASLFSSSPKPDAVPRFLHYDRSIAY
jgi:hypothetical protein